MRARTKPSPGNSPDEPDYAEIAAQLRGFATVSEGGAYLAGLRLRGKKATKADLIKLGAETGVSVSDSMRLPDLQGRLVNHAIGARKKYAGLTKW